jgi:hypothetical protein
MSKKNKHQGYQSDEEKNKLNTPFEGTQQNQQDGSEDWKDPYLSAEVDKGTPKGAEGTTPENEDTRKRSSSSYQEQSSLYAEDSGEEEGGEYEEEENEAGEGIDFEAAGRKAMKFIEEKTANLDKKQIAKYAAAGALVLIGLRKSGFLRGLAVTAAAGVLAKYLAENSSELLGKAEGEEGEEEESYEGEEAETPTMGTL